VLKSSLSEFHRSATNHNRIVILLMSWANASKEASHQLYRLQDSDHMSIPEGVSIVSCISAIYLNEWHGTQEAADRQGLTTNGCQPLHTHSSPEHARHSRGILAKKVLLLNDQAGLWECTRPISNPLHDAVVGS